MVRSAVVASSPLAILRSNHARSTSARDVEGDSAEGRGALRYRGCAHSQLRDFPSNRLSVRTSRSPESRGSSLAGSGPEPARLGATTCDKTAGCE